MQIKSRGSRFLGPARNEDTEFADPAFFAWVEVDDDVAIEKTKQFMRNYSKRHSTGGNKATANIRRVRYRRKPSIATALQLKTFPHCLLEAGKSGIDLGEQKLETVSWIGGMIHHGTGAGKPPNEPQATLGVPSPTVTLADILSLALSPSLTDQLTPFSSETLSHGENHDDEDRMFANGNLFGAVTRTSHLSRQIDQQQQIAAFANSYNQRQAVAPENYDSMPLRIPGAYPDLPKHPISPGIIPQPHRQWSSLTSDDIVLLFRDRKLALDRGDIARVALIDSVIRAIQSLSGGQVEPPTSGSNGQSLSSRGWAQGSRSIHLHEQPTLNDRKPPARQALTEAQARNMGPLIHFFYRAGIAQSGDQQDKRSG